MTHDAGNRHGLDSFMKTRHLLRNLDDLMKAREIAQFAAHEITDNPLKSPPPG
jgi:hypothetical protein